MTTQAQTPEMEKAPQRFTGGMFIRVEVDNTVKGTLKAVEYREEEKTTGKGKSKKIETVQKPYYVIELSDAGKFNLRVDESEKFDAGALVKFQGKGSLHADMKAFLAKDQGVDAKTFVEADEAGTLDFSPLYGYLFSIKRLSNEEGKGKYKGTAFTRWDVQKSKEKVA